MKLLEITKINLKDISDLAIKYWNRKLIEKFNAKYISTSLDY